MAQQQQQQAGAVADKQAAGAGGSGEAKAAAPPPETDNTPWLMVLHSADICVLYQTPDLLYRRAENLPAALQANWRLLCRDGDLFPPAVAAAMAPIKQRLLAGGPQARLECRLPRAPAAPGAAEAAGAIDGPENPVLWFKFFIEAHYNAQGEIIGLVTTGVNISELRAREEVLKVLLREVSHRSKNLLAIIQSIATQTARFCHTISGFLQKFQGRLQSLASSQDLVTDADWRGALLRDLIFAQLRFYTDTIADKKQCSVVVEGKNPYLFPAAALHIGLALHELIINSAAFGALAQGKGKIAIACRAEEEEAIAPPAGGDRADKASAAGGAAPDSAAPGSATAHNKALVLSWREEFPMAAESAAAAQDSATAAPEQGDKAEGEAGTAAGADNAVAARFGSIMLERIVPQSVDGAAKYSIKNGKVEYFIKIPAAQFA